MRFNQLTTSLQQILIQCQPSPEMYNLNFSEPELATCLDLAIETMLSKLEEVDHKLFEMVKKGQIAHHRALALQQQTNSVMNLLFSKWVATDASAESFLKKHNGFHLMLKRLFREDAQVAESVQRSEAEAPAISSDESSDSSSDAEGQIPGAKSRAKKKFLKMGMDAAELMKKNFEQPVLRKQDGIQEAPSFGQSLSAAKNSGMLAAFATSQNGGPLDPFKVHPFKADYASKLGLNQIAGSDSGGSKPKVGLQELSRTATVV